MPSKSFKRAHVATESGPLHEYPFKRVRASDTISSLPTALLQHILTFTMNPVPHANTLFRAMCISKSFFLAALTHPYWIPVTESTELQSLKNTSTFSRLRKSAAIAGKRICEVCCFVSSSKLPLCRASPDAIGLFRLCSVCFKTHLSAFIAAHSQASEHSVIWNKTQSQAHVPGAMLVHLDHTVTQHKSFNRRWTEHGYKKEEVMLLKVFLSRR
ncbi:hypothetical protein BC830DRAFT_1167818 [Chytriomyces sp. MP71]|nr:hypothetical protein BC830DRAFT_1167818 [Chytriomyces sp. MP71]